MVVAASTGIGGRGQEPAAEAEAGGAGEREPEDEVGGVADSGGGEGGGEEDDDGDEVGGDREFDDEGAAPEAGEVLGRAMKEDVALEGLAHRGGALGAEGIEGEAGEFVGAADAGSRPLDDEPGALRWCRR